MIVSSTSYSQTTRPPTPAPSKARLAKGAKAPFAGVLLTDKALAKIITDHEKRVGALELQLEKEKRDRRDEAAAAAAICTAKVNGEAAKGKAASTGWISERRLYEGALAKANQSPWYKSPYLNFLLGTVVSGGVCAGAFAAGR